MPSYRRSKLYRLHSQPTTHSSDTDEASDDAGNSYDPEYDELEQPLHGYPFEVGCHWSRLCWPTLSDVCVAQLGQTVWVRPTRKWYRGHIVKVVKLDPRSRKVRCRCGDSAAIALTDESFCRASWDVGATTSASEAI